VLERDVVISAVGDDLHLISEAEVARENGTAPYWGVRVDRGLPAK
jgi:hypothetical protein